MLAYGRGRMPALFAAAATTTTEVPRVVGDPLPTWLVWLSGGVLLVLIVAAGVWARNRQRD